MKNIVTAVLISLSISISAQSNKEAQNLLEEVKTKTESYKTQTIEFTNEIDAPTGKADNSRSKRTSTGSALVKGQKYRVTMEGVIILHDGANTYMIYPDDEEINVMESDPEDGSLTLTPSSILSTYQTGYSYAMAGTEKINGQTIQYIRLKPKASAEVKEIMIGINSATKQLYSFKQFGHNDVITTLTVTSYKVNEPLKDELFSIKAPEFSSFEVFE